MPESFQIDPSLLHQTVLPPNHDGADDLYDSIAPLAIGLTATGSDNVSGLSVNWDLDDDGQYDDLFQAGVGLRTELPQIQLDELGWNGSGTHKVAAIVSGGNAGNQHVDGTISINTAPVTTSGVKNYLYGDTATMTFADLDGDKLEYSNFSVSGGADYASISPFFTIIDNTVTVHVTGIAYVNPSDYDDQYWDSYWGDISVSFTVSDGQSSYTHRDYYELQPDVRRGPVPGSGVFQGDYRVDDYTAPDDKGWSLSGLGAADRLTGAAGNDRIDGGVGSDLLAGAAGDDVIQGGSGKDALTGGTGSDRFVFLLGDSKAGGGLRDVITDFQIGADKIDLSGYEITNFSSEVTFKSIGSGLIVYVDTNHNGFDYNDFGLQLTGVKALQESDFLL